MITRIDSLNNCGLPQLANTLREYQGNIYHFSKSDIKLIVEKIKDLDSYYTNDSWKKSISRAILKELVNSWCDSYRNTSLIID